jgi:hypothetical protein
MAKVARPARTGQGRLEALSTARLDEPLEEALSYLDEPVPVNKDLPLTVVDTEQAATLGLVDVAYTTPEDARKDFRSMWGTDELRFLSRYDGLSCVRLTGLGAFCLDLGDSHEPTVAPPASRVSILPTLDIVADRGRFDPGDETFLSTFCVRRGTATPSSSSRQRGCAEENSATHASGSSRKPPANSLGLGQWTPLATRS